MVQIVVHKYFEKNLKKTAAGIHVAAQPTNAGRQQA